LHAYLVCTRDNGSRNQYSKGLGYKFFGQSDIDQFWFLKGSPAC